MPSYDSIIIGFGKGGKTLAATFAASGQSVAPVSYTHLDVYKRQVLERDCHVQ